MYVCMYICIYIYVCIYIERKRVKKKCEDGQLLT